MTISTDEGTFLRLRCASCGADEHWARCDACGRQALFALGADAFSCGCGASYDHAVCRCGEPVLPAQLEAVPLAQGPLVWSELEPDWRKIGALAALGVAGAAGIVWWFLGG